VARGDRQARVARRPGGGDGVAIGFEITLGVVRRLGRLAEHVERADVATGPLQSLVDGAAKHEMAAHNLHGRPHRLADRRLAQPPGQATDRRVFRGGHQRLGHHEAEGGGVDHQAGRGAQVRAPVAGRQLVLDQGPGGVGVRHPQIGLGQAHQRHALAFAEAVFAQETLDPGRLMAADGGDEAGGAGVDRPTLLRGQARFAGETGQRLRFRSAMEAGEVGVDRG
jgi:hypothetical protein